MRIAQMHVDIDQGVQQSGRFANRKLSSEEIDIAIFDETILLIDKIFEDRQAQPSDFEENIFTAQVTRLYKKEAEQAVVDYGEYCETEIPSDLHNLINHQVMFYLGTKVDHLEVNGLYRCLVKTKYNTTWLEKNTIFRTNSTDGLFLFGQVEKLSKTYYPVRLLSSEKIHTFRKSHYYRSKKDNPISEFLGNQLRIYEDNFKVDGVKITYSKLPIRTDYKNEVDSDLPENIQVWLINKVIARILNQTDQPQQKLLNLTSDIIK